MDFFPVFLLFFLRLSFYFVAFSTVLKTSTAIKREERAEQTPKLRKDSEKREAGDEPTQEEEEVLLLHNRENIHHHGNI